MSDISEYLKEKIAEFRLARFFGEMAAALGTCISITGIFLKILILTITGFSLLFTGLYLSVHYELQRLDYTHALEKISHKGR